MGKGYTDPEDEEYEEDEDEEEDDDTESESDEPRFAKKNGKKKKPNPLAVWAEKMKTAEE